MLCGNTAHLSTYECLCSLHPAVVKLRKWKRARTTEPKVFITQSLLLRFVQPRLRDRHTQRQVCLSAQQCGLKERAWGAGFRLIRSRPSPSAKAAGCLHLEMVRQALPGHLTWLSPLLATGGEPIIILKVSVDAQ